MPSRYATAAGFAFVDLREGIVFLAHRSHRVSEPNTWGFPGGHIDDGEYPLDAAMRECIEEVGVLPPFRLIGGVKVPFRNNVCVIYVAEVEAASLADAKPDGFETDGLNWAVLAGPAPSDAHPGVKKAWALIQSTVKQASRA